MPSLGRTAYPTGQDIQAYLESAKLKVTSLFAPFLETAAEAGRLEFERRTGRIPFLAAATDTTRYLDPPTRSHDLFLDPGLLSLTSVSYHPTGSSATALVAATDFTPYPWNYAADARAIQRLRFSTRRWSSPLPLAQRGSLAVTGRWGYVTSLPEDAWLAVCAFGALTLVPQLAFSFTSGIIKWSADDGTSESYSANPLEPLASGWQRQAERAVATYRRISF